MPSASGRKNSVSFVAAVRALGTDLIAQFLKSLRSVLDTYLLEIATYPEARVASQIMDDIALSWLGRHVLPEVVVLFLYPKGNVVPAETIKLNSRQGCTTWDASWRIVKLWEVPADELLATGDVGVVPWVPLARFEGPVRHRPKKSELSTMPVVSNVSRTQHRSGCRALCGRTRKKTGGFLTRRIVALPAWFRTAHHFLEWTCVVFQD